MTPQELDRITKALCAVEQIKRIESMDDEEMRGMSGRMSRRVDGNDRMNARDYQGVSSRRMYDGMSGHSIGDNRPLCGKGAKWTLYIFK